MTAGNYTVSLNVTNLYGFNSTTKTGYIRVNPFNLPPPAITAITPVSGYRNSTVSFTLTGTNFQPGYTVVEFRNQSSGFIPTSLTSVTATQINGIADIPLNASAGLWNIRLITTSGGENIKLNAFTVIPTNPPTISTLTPGTGYKNTTVDFTITGTNFQTGMGKTGVRVYENVADTELAATVTNVTATSIIGTINITNQAFAGSYNLNVSTVDGGTATKPAAFTVTNLPTPTITALSPAAGFQNTTVGFTITGTYFQPGNTVVLFTDPITGRILNTAALDSITSTRITGNITIPYNASTRSYRLDVSTADGGFTNKVNAFTVNPVPAPQITSITPQSGAKNSVVAFTLNGANFQVENKTTVKIVEDATPTNLAVTIYNVTPTRIIGSVTIPATVPQGLYRVEVTTVDGGTANKIDAFTVNYMALPVISAITPTSGYQNSTVRFTLTGNNFLDGGTIVRLRSSGVTINATPTLNSVSTTSITGTFRINITDTTGPYRIDVITNGGGINSKQNGFTVNTNPPPTIASITPTTGYRGTTVSFTIDGTNFEPDLTSVNLTRTGSSDIATMLTSVTTTQIKGTAFLGSGTTTGLWNINVTTTDGGTARMSNAINIL
jgi:hypothetical protein